MMIKSSVSEDALITGWSQMDTSWLLYSRVEVENKLLFSTRLMKIYEHERNLNSGRFKRFSESVYQNNIVSFDNQETFDGGRHPWFEKWINWIADNTFGSWLVQTRHYHLNKACVSFFFEKPSDAGMFKMVWM